MNDSNLTPSHLALYVCLIHKFNRSKFKNPFYIHRAELQQQCKIKSKVTFLKLLKDLEAFQFIEITPSKNYAVGTLVKFTNLNVEGKEIIQVQESVSNFPRLNINLRDLNLNNNSIKTFDYLNKVDPKYANEDMIIEFFESNNSTKASAQKFYNHYQSTGWLKVNNIKIIDWKASALKWISNDHKNYNSNQKSKKHDPYTLVRNKKYDTPL